MLLITRTAFGRSICTSRLFSSNDKNSENNSQWLKQLPEITAGTHDVKIPRKVIQQEIKSWSKSPMITDGLVKYPRECETVIIGGGLVGQAAAYFIKKLTGHTMQVAIIEKDPTYKVAASALNVSGVRQHFSIKENIELSLFTCHVLQNMKEYFGLPEDPQYPEINDHIEIPYQPCGYLYLASQSGADILNSNYNTQVACNAKVIKLSPSQLKQRFPWLNTDGVELGVYGVENEGYVDQWALMNCLKKINMFMGVRYINAEVTDFVFDKGGAAVGSEINTLLMKPPDEDCLHPTQFANCIVAAGPWSGAVGKMLQMGLGEGVLAQPLPVEPRKRYVYVVHCPTAPGLDMPLLVDPLGAYVRREGYNRMYLCGKSPCPDEAEPSCDNLDVDYNYFEEVVWPTIANRVPAFECAKLKSSWGGYYDYNYVDQNLVFGAHPQWSNVFFATGLSGHGFQHALGVGRGVAERLIHGEDVSIQFNKFKFERFYDETSLIFEECCV